MSYRCIRCAVPLTIRAVDEGRSLCLYHRMVDDIGAAERAATEKAEADAIKAKGYPDISYHIELERLHSHKAALARPWESEPVYEDAPPWGSAVMCPVG